MRKLSLKEIKQTAQDYAAQKHKSGIQSQAVRPPEDTVTPRL